MFFIYKCQNSVETANFQKFSGEGPLIYKCQNSVKTANFQKFSGEGPRFTDFLQILAEGPKWSGPEY